MTPRVSVLIPVHNRADLLGACIESALAQTLGDLEVVVVDNASSDGTWAVCERYAARDGRVRIARNAENLGPVGNWRRCLELARAPLAKLLFSDDAIAPQYFERTVPLLDDAGTGFVFTAAYIGPRPWQDGAVAYAWPEADAVADSRAFLREALLGDRLPVSPGAALFRLADLRRNLRTDVPAPAVRGFFDTGAGLDLLLYLLTARDYPRVAHLREPLCFFRAHDRSISLERRALVLDQYLQARTWFAAGAGSPASVREVLLRGWWAHGTELRRAPPFAEFSARFLGRPLPLKLRDRFWIWRRTRRVTRPEA